MTAPAGPVMRVVVDIENMLMKHIQEGKKLLERYKQLDNVN